MKERKRNLIEIQKLAFTVDEFAQAASIGKTAVYEAINANELIARKRGKSTLIVLQDAVQFLQSLPTLKPKDIQKGTQTN